MRWKRKNTSKTRKLAFFATSYQPSTNNYQLPKQVPKFNKIFHHFEISAPPPKNNFPQLSGNPFIRCLRRWKGKF